MTTPLGTHHAQAAAGRWATLTLVEQMAHIGSEVDRAVRAKEGRREQRFEQALSRALELFDLTATDSRWVGPRRREILRAREEFCRLFYDPAVSHGSAAGLCAYFLQFAIAARQKPATAPD